MMKIRNRLIEVLIVGSMILTIAVSAVLAIAAVFAVKIIGFPVWVVGLCGLAMFFVFLFIVDSVSGWIAR